ncbi:hypothetical protein [Acrocarpospora catenulata]|uniref:hypothetical protein n=1 Tax=Acrocarpospora catenulata TaxID=2836182 RepID=UPI001BD9EAFA|nr:hypothetical protein [Acrocarpospora catenulata]
MATAFGFLLLGSLLRAPFPILWLRIFVAAAAVVLLLQEIGVLKFPIPQNARLVPQFVTRIPFWGSVQFGMEMGTGMRTYSPTALPHVMAIAVMFLASWPEALLAGAGFALGRTVMLLTFVTARSKMSADTAFYFTLPRLRPLFVLLIIPMLVPLVLP